MPLRLEQLRYLLTVAEEGQMTRAARKLHLAQPALSQAIAQLEAELGIDLLVRHARGVTLTPDGEKFLQKARLALAAANDAAVTAETLARSAAGMMEVGFIGPPPMINAPELFATFADEHPDAHISFRELPFPSGPTASWLDDVDVAFCHPPAVEPSIRVQAVRAEARTVVMPETHPMADREQLSAKDVLGETFLGYDSAVQPLWAGFHSLDDVRGRPAVLTDERAVTAAEMLALMASRRGIATVPHSDARIIERVLRGVVAIPIRDVEPALLALLWRRENSNPLVRELVAAARRLVAATADGAVPQPLSVASR
jgi:DNA-binding transcriptional LysR family regulator